MSHNQKATISSTFLPNYVPHDQSSFRFVKTDGIVVDDSSLATHDVSALHNKEERGSSLRENLTILPFFVREQADKARSLSLDGPVSFRVMAFLAGLFMMFTACINIVGSILVFSFREFVISFYVLFFGLITCLIEGQATESRHKLRYHVKMLEFTWGRGVFYIFSGLLQFSQGKFMLDRLSGIIMMVIGALSTRASAAATEKLASLREAIYNEKELYIRFDEADEDEDGYITVYEFEKLCKALGVSLTYHELVASFANVDKDEDECISYEEFESWWSKDSTQSSLFDGLEI